MDEATWYLDSEDSSPLGSPSTPPTLNGEWPCCPAEGFLLYSLCGDRGETTRSQQAQQSEP